jgi:Diaminopimelate epimerase
MKFFKVHSLGNDFLVMDKVETRGLSNISSFAGTICDRHTGVGADGLLLISVKNKQKVMSISAYSMLTEQRQKFLVTD